MPTKRPDNLDEAVRLYLAENRPRQARTETAHEKIRKQYLDIRRHLSRVQHERLKTRRKAHTDYLVQHAREYADQHREEFDDEDECP